jgi:hypothetical protein
LTQGGQPPAWNQPLAKARVIITPSVPPVGEGTRADARPPSSGTLASHGAAAKQSVASAEPTMPMPRMRRAPKRSVSCPLTSCTVA